MAGLNTILDRIRQEGGEKAQELTAAAKAEAEKILDAAKEKAAAAAAKAEQDASSESERMRARYASYADTRRKQAFLSAKQDLISSCIGKAKENILSQDDGAYFGMLMKMLSERLQPKDGILSFSEKDLSRLPASFAGEAMKLAEEKGGTVTISEKAAPIDGGFILAYGGIEENCGVSALFEEKKEQLSDAVQKLLFS